MSSVMTPIRQSDDSSLGPIVRIGPNVLITSSPDVWSHINAVRSPYKRSDWYYHAARFKPGEDHVFSETDNEKHDKKRKQMFTGVCLA